MISYELGTITVVMVIIVLDNSISRIIQFSNYVVVLTKKKIRHFIPTLKVRDHLCWVFPSRRCQELAMFQMETEMPWSNQGWWPPLEHGLKILSFYCNIEGERPFKLVLPYKKVPRVRNDPDGDGNTLVKSGKVTGDLWDKA